ncbi:MAG TPA: cyclase family protein [Streptosporangiaceae bacterium]|nr:cyclase family protein [Streptosporangiaceae bacterium]
MANAVPASPWGPADQVGAANQLTQDLVSRALRLATSGRVFDLSFPVSMQAPTHPVYLTPYFICLNHQPWASEKYERENAGATNGIGWAQERIELDMHTGTHVDALGHATASGRAFNNFPLLDVYGNWGLLKLGIENLPPLLTRGILADVAGYRGHDMKAGDAISADELRAVLRAQRVEVRPGDIVMVRTGWAQYWGVDNDKYMLGGCPGISLDAAQWLAASGVIAVGADQAAVEVWPSERPGDVFPVHVELLVKSGVYLIEQAQLEEIARERLYEFLIVCVTPKFAGATGSPVRLLAIA